MATNWQLARARLRAALRRVMHPAIRPRDPLTQAERCRVESSAIAFVPLILSPWLDQASTVGARARLNGPSHPCRGAGHSRPQLRQPIGGHALAGACALNPPCLRRLCQPPKAAHPGSAFPRFYVRPHAEALMNCHPRS